MRQTARTVLFTSIFLAIMSHKSVAEPIITYTISMPSPHTHYFEVEMMVTGLTNTNEVNFKLPVWAPGSYLVREFAQGVEAFEVFDSSGSKLISNKINKNTWQIQKAQAQLTVRYKVYAFEMSVRTSFIDADHGYINGSSVFMYIEGLQSLPSSINIIPFEAWKVVSTSLDKVSGKEFSYTSSNYDELVDSPIAIGNQLVFDFIASGVKHHVAMSGEGNFNVEQLKKDMASVVESCTSVFGENPNEEYTFIIHNLDKGNGGLEHAKSTSLQVNRWTYTNSMYIDFLSLVAHEYFHVWLAKRLRPIELGPFNYDQENYTRSLWVIEGFTSFYDELLLLKAGLVDENYFFNKLKGGINYIENLPGNDVQSLTEASYDAWIKAYRPNENSRNTTISYYTKGSVIANLLDLIITDATKGNKSLDNVLQELYQTYFKEKKRGFTEEELKSTIERVAGIDLTDFFDAYIYGTEEIPYDSYFQFAGVKIEKNNTRSQLPSIGASLKDENGKLIVKSVTRGTSAYEGGLNVNDEIISVGNYRVNKSEFEKLFYMQGLGNDIALIISRDGILKSLNMKLISDNHVSYSMIDSKKKSKKQEKVFSTWLRKTSTK